jgi:hypothetical protein
VPDLIGVLFALRLVDYEAGGSRREQWRFDDSFRHYVSLLIELGYQPSEIERELFDQRPDPSQQPAEEGH